MNEAAIGKRDQVWQLAAGGEVAWNVVAACGMEAKVCRAFTRIENDCLPPKFVAHEVEGRDEVGIAR